MPPQKSHQRIAASSLFLIVFLLPTSLRAEERIHHDLKVFVKPENNFLQVSDTITVPEPVLAASKRKLNFRLHSGLQPASPTPGVMMDRKADQEQYGGDLAAADERRVSEQYTVSLPAGRRDFTIRYHGLIKHPITHQGHTAGMIIPEGIFLGGMTQWYPWFNDDLVTFILEVQLPEAWEAISQGERTRHERHRGVVEIRWESPDPQEEIYFVGGRFTEFDRPAGAIQLMAFLQTPDEALADRYLGAAASYLEMYQRLLGPYPHKKFAVIENFWESSYGMPSFTLIGPSMIRLPGILHSSYPHEILHNWWSHGVRVNYDKGNWSEGLTRYLADYLVQEQNGTATEYRRTALQKYTDYATERKDFPLTEFRARHNPAMEAVGYGKTMMFFHMLRRWAGDETFIAALKKFYGDNLFRRATFDDLRASFSAVSGQDLAAEFAQWISRPGAPELRVIAASAREDGLGYLLTARLEQTQPGSAYALRVPVAVHLEGQDKAYQTVVAMNDKHLDLALSLPSRPVRLEIDPEFDLFRRFDRNEIPPALAQPLGAENTLFIIPGMTDAHTRYNYRKFIESLRPSLPGLIEIKQDTETDRIPSNRAAWILGWENRFLPNVKSALADYDLSVTPNGLRIVQTELPRNNRSIVLTARQPGNPRAPLVWLAADPITALPGLARSLPSYGQNSYLAFEGDAPTNVLRGRWTVLNSPLSIPVQQPDGGILRDARASFEPRRALADLPKDEK